MTSSPVIYLASQSARRRALLEQAGIAFSVLSLEGENSKSLKVIETPRDHEKPIDYVKRMARTKAMVGLRRMRALKLKPLPVLGADTEVILGDRVFGKPKNESEGALMLLALSGVTHEVISSVAVAGIERSKKYARVEEATIVTRVTMKTLSPKEMDHYIASYEWQDKAGGYAIQGKAGAFVTHLSGSFTGVVGLPLYETLALIASFQKHCPL